MKKTPEEIERLNEASSRNFILALVAEAAASEQRKRGTVAARHLARLSKRHMSLSELFDKVLKEDGDGG